MRQTTEYFAVDSEGYLLSTLMLTPDEVPKYGGVITQTRPPERPRPTPVTPSPWDAVRAARNRKLAASDCSVLPDVPMTVERRQRWEAYRQALRDITDQTDLSVLVWPTPPA